LFPVSASTTLTIQNGLALNSTTVTLNSGGTATLLVSGAIVGTAKWSSMAPATTGESPRSAAP
jgi:hypothetical protein